MKAKKWEPWHIPGGIGDCNINWNKQAYHVYYWNACKFVIISLGECKGLSYLELLLKYFGPLLFIIYINDIVQDIGSFLRLFVDDTTLWVIVDDPLLAVKFLNADLQK